MGKNKRIVKLRARRRPNNSCIPKKVDNPNITINKDGKKVLDYNLDLLTPYREVKEKYVKYNKEHYSGKKNSIRKIPWYTMTSGKCFNYEEREEPFGKATKYYRIPSEAKIFTDKTTIPKMTHEKYKELLVDAKLKDWEKKHPRPIPKDDAQRDLFEAQFMVPWVDEHTKERERLIEFVNNIGNRAKVFARYDGDKDYSTRVMSLKSDGCTFMKKEGKFTNYDSPNIRKVQRAADSIKENNPKLIALKIVDREQECIIVPKIAA